MLWQEGLVAGGGHHRSERGENKGLVSVVCQDRIDYILEVSNGP